MPVLKIEPSGISQIITDHIKDTALQYVFPTDKAADTWADWTVSFPEITGTTAVAMERFTAWDTFKSTVLAAEKKEKTSIPSLLRKLFAGSIIAENAEKAAAGSPLFSVIINRAYAASAASFTDWIAKIIPSLAGWKKKYDRWLAEQGGVDTDDENADYLLLYTRYRDYLDQCGLFDPAWEDAIFSDSKNRYVIFYPELLEDFSDYEEQLRASDSITLITLPDEPPQNEHPTVAFFSNARTELRRTALYIRRLHDGGTEWTDIAVNVPDIETYGPYLKREFDLYAIPYTFRSGTPLTAHSAGRIFREIQECVSSSFSYDSVRSLLLDGYVPWKNRAENEALIREGNEKKCLCSYEENGHLIDIWEKSLSDIHTVSADDDGAATKYALLHRKYHQLRTILEKMCTARTFRDIRTQWFTFRSRFLDEAAFTPEANLVLGRCIAELSELIDIEENYLNSRQLLVPSPYRFFVNELNNKNYVPQSRTDGVSIFPYRLAACAYYAYQFIVDASQTALTVPYRRFAFLREDKRKALHLDDRDISSHAFIRLYAKSAVIFSTAEETFGGFSIPHSYLVKSEEPDSTDSGEPATEPSLRTLEQNDFITLMKDSFLSGDYENFPDRLPFFLKDGFAHWKLTNTPPETAAALQYAESSPVVQKIHQLLYVKRSAGEKHAEMMHISQTDMKNFFPCPRKWIFSQVLHLEDDTLDTTLMEPYDAGLINHRILELFMVHRKETGEPLPVVGSDGLFNVEEDIRSELDAYVMEAIRSPDMKFSGSPLVMAVLESQKVNFTEAINNFLHLFCSTYGGYLVKNAEDWFRGQPDGKRWTYIGKLDCVLCNQNGDDISIVDYKSSRAPALRDCIVSDSGELADFQMPMYVTLWQLNCNGGQNGGVENALFYTIQDGKAHYVVKNDAKDEKMTPKVFFETTVKQFEDYTERFASAVERRDFPISRVKPYEDCTACRFRPVCRTTYQVSGRNPESEKTTGGN